MARPIACQGQARQFLQSCSASSCSFCARCSSASVAICRASRPTCSKGQGQPRVAAEGGRDGRPCAARRGTWCAARRACTPRHTRCRRGAGAPPSGGPHRAHEPSATPAGPSGSRWPGTRHPESGRATEQAHEDRRAREVSRMGHRRRQQGGARRLVERGQLQRPRHAIQGARARRRPLQPAPHGFAQARQSIGLEHGDVRPRRGRASGQGTPVPRVEDAPRNAARERGVVLHDRAQHAWLEEARAEISLAPTQRRQLRFVPGIGVGHFGRCGELGFDHRQLLAVVGLPALALAERVEPRVRLTGSPRTLPSPVGSPCTAA